MIDKIVIGVGCYLLGNEKARIQVGKILTKGIQTGIDTLNKRSPINNMTNIPKTDSVEKSEE